MTEQELAQIHNEFGLGMIYTNEPYMCAVADALRREEIEVAYFHVDDDDLPRQGDIQLLAWLPDCDPDEDDALGLVWQEDLGWRLDDGIEKYPLPVSTLAEPHQVAQALLDILERGMAKAGRRWTPPAGFNPAGRSDYGDPYGADPVTFERSLCCYVTHPAWGEYCAQVTVQAEL